MQYVATFYLEKFDWNGLDIDIVWTELNNHKQQGDIA